VRASINIQLMGIYLVISGDYEHENRMDYIMSASAIHPMTQVGYVAIH
jgi:hypothetical protein